MRTEFEQLVCDISREAAPGWNLAAEVPHWRATPEECLAISKAFLAEFPAVAMLVSDACSRVSLIAHSEDHTPEEKDARRDERTRALALMETASRMISSAVTARTPPAPLLDAIEPLCRAGGTVSALEAVSRGLFRTDSKHRRDVLSQIPGRAFLHSEPRGPISDSYIRTERDGPQNILGMAVAETCKDPALAPVLSSILNSLAEGFEWGRRGGHAPFGFVAYRAEQAMGACAGNFTRFADLPESCILDTPAGFWIGMAAQFQPGSKARRRLFDSLFPLLSQMDPADRADFAKVVWLGADKSEILSLCTADRTLVESAARTAAVASFNDGLGSISDVSAKRPCSSWLARALKSMGLAPDVEKPFPDAGQANADILLGCLAHLEASELAKAARAAEKSSGKKKPPRKAGAGSKTI